jgi:hypothetical protein
MNVMKKTQSLILSIVALCGIPAIAQTGGGFDLSHSVIAGGGERSTGGGFTLDGTVGQSNAGTNSTDGTFSLRSGFWAFDSFAPTAARATVGGRVLTANGSPIDKAIVILSDASGAIRSAVTNPFGYYKFEDVGVGETYFVSIRSKQFTFANPTLVINVFDNVEDVDFTANE